MDPTMVTAGNVLRMINLVLGGGTTLIAALVCVVYGRRYRRDRRLAHVQGERLAWRGLLPMHVILISTSYVSLLLVCLWLVFANLDHRLTWRTVLVTVAMITGLPAMWMVARWQRRIYPRHDVVPPAPALRDPADPLPPPG